MPLAGQWVRAHGAELTLFSCLALIYLAVLVMFNPTVPPTTGDGPSYIQSMHVLAGQAIPDFMPNRLLSTLGGLEAVRAISVVTGDYFSAWFVLNTIFFFALGWVSFALLRRIGSEWPAVLGALFIAGNYNVLTSGLTYLMDIGGWAFYMFSLYFLYRYVEDSRRRDLLLAAAMVGVGTLFKEYAAVAVIPIAAVMLYEYGRTPLELVKKATLPALIAAGPILLVHLGVFATYHYTYLDWYHYNNHQYGYHGWLSNAVKSFGVTLQLLAIPAVIGFWEFFRSGEHRASGRRTVFLLSLVIPALVIFVWPSITERVVYLVVPTAAVFAVFCFQRSRTLWPLWAGLLAAYVAISLTTDSYLLSHINLPF